MSDLHFTAEKRLDFSS